MKNLLLSMTFFSGFFALIGIFLFCFALVHLLRWALAYYLMKKTAFRPKDTEQKQQKTEVKREKPAEKPPEKIYYIVERKKKRESPKYSEPKEFRFK